MIWLHETVIRFFSSFNDLMQLRGEIFRELENRRTQRIRINGQDYFLKQHNGIGWKEIFKNLIQLRWPILSAKNEVYAIQRLHQLNIPTLTLMGYGWEGYHPAYQESFLLTKALPPHISLEDLIKQPISFQKKQFLIRRVAEIAKTLHQNGINHRDFYLCHLLLDYNTPRIYVIDLHRAGVRHKTPERWIIKDLAGLYFSSIDAKLTQHDWLRFIKIYTDKPLADRDKAFWHKVKNRGEKLYRKHAR